MLPLTDVRVLDLTNEAGFATLELADYGADVIKVEKPGPGDRIRTFPPLEQGVSLSRPTWTGARRASPWT